MLLENYRLDTMVGGEAQTAIPYPRISNDAQGAAKKFRFHGR